MNLDKDILKDNRLHFTKFIVIPQVFIIF